ncbi:MAG TPA: AsmA-like C-terminal domain-containing protein [Alphaproteobacteria bacterium]|nr:AsmA-like C-terminal domain-containing protein [Alphaproteobacteria bacterium]
MVPHSVKIFLEVIVTLLAGLVIVAALALWRLSAGPISLDFLTPYFESALSATDNRFSVRLDSTVLLWDGWSRPLDLRARGIHVLDPQGEPLATLPEMAMRLSVSALKHGVVAPTSLEAIGARVHLRRRADGALDLKFSDEAREPNLPGVVPTLTADLLKPTDPQHPLSYLREISITNAELVIDDARWDTSWKTHIDRLAFDRDAVGIRGSASIQFTVNQNVSHVYASGLYVAATQLINLSASFAEVRPAVFARATPALAPLEGFSLPLSGHLESHLDLAGHIEELHFNVAGGSGGIQIADLFPDEIAVQSISLSGALEDRGERLTLDQALVDLGGTTIGLSGAVTGLEGVSQFAMELTAHNLKIDQFPQLWPPKLAPNPRAWITANLSGGAVQDMHAKIIAHGDGLDLASVKLDQLGGTMTLSDIDVHYLGKMPSVSGTSGEVQFDDKSFNISLSKGAVEGLSIDQGTIAITGLDGDDHRIGIDLAISGSLQGALRLIDYEPLGYASALGLDPKTVDGTVSAQLDLKFPLLHDLRFAQVQLGATADLKDVSIANEFFDQDVTNGVLALKVDKDGMNVTGTANIGPAPATFSWNERFGKTIDRTVHLKAELDDASRKAFELDYDGMLLGPTPLDLQYHASDRTSAKIEVSVDLGRSTMTLPYTDWRKDPGTPGTARLSLVTANDKLKTISSFDVEAGDLVARGQADFDVQTGALRTIGFDRLTFGHNDLFGRVERRTDGTYDVRVRGPSIDVSPLVKLKKTSETAYQMGPTAPPERGPRLALNIAADTLWLSNRTNQTLHDASASIDYDGLRPTRAEVDAKTKSGAPVTIRITPADNSRDLLISSTDAGEVFRALDFTDDIVRGKLVVTARYDDTVPESPLAGTVKIDDYAVLNAPLMAKILTLASFSGIVDRMNGEGIGFSSLAVSFTKTGPLITMQDGHTSGSDLGFTFEGTFDLDAETVMVKGTIVPIYTLNSLLGHIPLLGDILVGPKGGGLFAATYQANGKIDNPNVSVNALSALAPGILRELISGSSASAPEQAQTPSSGTSPPAQIQPPRLNDR